MVYNINASMVHKWDPKKDGGLKLLALDSKAI